MTAEVKNDLHFMKPTVLNYWSDMVLMIIGSALGVSIMVALDIIGSGYKALIGGAVGGVISGYMLRFSVRFIQYRIRTCRQCRKI
jgi:hypothetical protein